ncbi:MAG: hydrolase, partial [Prevotella sp.]
MNILMKYESKYWRNIFARIALIAISVLVIVWFMPRNESQRMKYDIGKPWMYGSFIAKFDFPIYKTDENIKSEQDSMLKHFQPYYNFNANVERNEIAKFKKDFKFGIQGMPIEYINIIANKLHQIYQTGVINTPEYSSLARDTTNMVRVVVGKRAKSVRVNKVFSTMTAYEKLLKDHELTNYRLELQKCDLTDYIAPNLSYDKKRCTTERNDLLGSIPLASGMVMSGQKIIDRGEIIDDYTFRVLSSFEREMQRRNATVTEITNTLIGQIMYVTILITLLTIYLALFRQDYFSKPRSIMMLYSVITIFPVLVSIMMEHNIFSVYIIPFAMVPIFIRVFMDSRTAFIAHATMILICAAAVKYQYEFIIIQLVAGLIAIYSLREMSKRS